MTFSDWLLSLHLLSAFALVSSLVLFWYLIVVWRNADTPEATLAGGRSAQIGHKLIIAGIIGTIVFGLWLAIDRAHIEVWSGWVLIAIVLWTIGSETGRRAGVEYRKAMDKAEELQAAGQTGPNADLLALNRTSRGLQLHTISTIAIALILVDMITKPGASDLPPPSSWNVPLLVHVTGAMILVGGMLTAATALVSARGDERRLRLGYYSLLFVAFPGMMLTKMGATAIWSKYSDHGFFRSAFPSRDDPTWIMIGGTALDMGAGALVLALIAGWFGLKKLDTKRGQQLMKLTTLISIGLLAAYVVTIWAMAGRPD
jgi:hypothetical protein